MVRERRCTAQEAVSLRWMMSVQVSVVDGLRGRGNASGASREPRGLHISQGLLALLVPSGPVFVGPDCVSGMLCEVARGRGCRRGVSAALRGVRVTSAC